MVNLKKIVERCKEINADKKTIENKIRDRFRASSYDERGLINGVWFKFELAYLYYLPKKIFTNSDIDKEKWDIDKILKSYGYK